MLNLPTEVCIVMYKLYWILAADNQYYAYFTYFPLTWYAELVILCIHPCINVDNYTHILPITSFPLPLLLQSCYSPPPVLGPSIPVIPIYMPKLALLMVCRVTGQQTRGQWPGAGWGVTLRTTSWSRMTVFYLITYSPWSRAIVYQCTKVSRPVAV